MWEKEKRVTIVVLGSQLLFWSGFALSWYLTDLRVRKEAVRNNAAVWKADEHGSPVFYWK